MQLMPRQRTASTDRTDPGGARDARALARALGESAGAIVIGSDDQAQPGHVHADGSAERLLHGSRVPVAVAPRGLADDPDFALRVVGVAFDGSPESEAALAEAAAIAERAGAAMRVFAVHAPERAAEMAAVYAAGMVAENGREWLRQTLEAAVGELPAALRAKAQLLDGDPPGAIAAQCELGVDLLVTGSRARGPLGRVLLGSTSSRLMHTAPCAVLAVPRPTRS